MNAAQSRHQQRAEAFMLALTEWQQSHGAERAYWRSRVLIEVANERRRIAAYTAWLRANAPTTTLKDAA